MPRHAFASTSKSGACRASSPPSSSSAPCVECFLGQEAACGGATTCDLLAKTCTGAAPASVQNSGACTNDLQCQAGHRCIAMDFGGNPHGYFCLQEANPTCDQPFSVAINKPSLSGASAVTYCSRSCGSETTGAVALFADGRIENRPISVAPSSSP